MTFYTVTEIAESVLKLSKSKVYELVEQGKIGHHRFDGAIRISDKQIKEYLAHTEYEPREPEQQPVRGLRRLRL